MRAPYPHRRSSGTGLGWRSSQVASSAQTRFHPCQPGFVAPELTDGMERLPVGRRVGLVAQMDLPTIPMRFCLKNRPSVRLSTKGRLFPIFLKGTARLLAECR